MPCELKLVSEKVSETKTAGRKLGGFLQKGSTVYLYGELGSGKTVFVKGMASALGIPEKDITSASFVLIAEHEGRLESGEKVPFYHIDLYRLPGVREAEAIGIEEYIDSDGVAVIEWADRLPEPGKGAIKVNINIVSGREREIIIEAIYNEKDRHNHERGRSGRG